MGRGIGQGIDYLHLFNDRARPTVRDDERQRILMFRPDMNEVNVQPVDLGDELRQGVHFCFDPAPVVVCRPVPGFRGRMTVSFAHCSVKRANFWISGFPRRTDLLASWVLVEDPLVFLYERVTP